MPAYMGGMQLVRVEILPAASNRFAPMRRRYDDRRDRRISRRGYFDLLNANVDARNNSAVVRAFRRSMLFIWRRFSRCMAVAMRNRRAKLTIAAGSTFPMPMPTTAHQDMEGESGDGDDPGEVHVIKEGFSFAHHSQRQYRKVNARRYVAAAYSAEWRIRVSSFIVTSAITIPLPTSAVPFVSATV